jgi:hypothetical protein
MSAANQSIDLLPVHLTIYLEGGHVDDLGSILPTIIFQSRAKANDEQKKVPNERSVKIKLEYDV